MTAQEYLNLLTKRLENTFDPYPLDKEPLPFDYVGQLHMADEGYFLVPSLKTYSVQHKEFLRAKIFTGPVSWQDLEPYLAYLKEQMLGYKTTTEHMSSSFTLVVICQEADGQLLEAVTKFKFHKDYAFTLKGWSDLCLALVDLSSQQVFLNKAAKKLPAYFELPKK